MKGTSLYINTARAAHGDMKGHGCSYITMKIGAIYASSTNSKINIVSSAEAGVISVGEKPPKYLWFRNFAVERFRDPEQVHILCQDNKSIIILQNNGRLSCGKGSKHIHILYFFITAGRIKQREIHVKYYCPTGDMIFDYSTKPLQGSIFKNFRNMILRIIEEDINTYKEDYKQALITFGISKSQCIQY